MNIRIETLIAEIAQKIEAGLLVKASPNLERDIRLCVMNNLIENNFCHHSVVADGVCIDCREGIA
jgi:hypothetical protein